MRQTFTAPAAIEQLETLGKQLTIPVFSRGTDISPVEIVRQALEEAEKEHHDIVIVDTAGRLHVDEKLMQELADIHELASPMKCS